MIIPKLQVIQSFDLLKTKVNNSLTEYIEQPFISGVELNFLMLIQG